MQSMNHDLLLLSILSADNDREIKEEDEKNNKLVKWYYMQEWDVVEEEVLEPES